MTLRQVDALTDSQITDLHRLYQREWWSEARSIDDVRAMLQHTDLVVGFVDEQDRLRSFCRVLTDFVYHAIVYDVIVAESLRGSGFGRQLIDAVVGHPRLQPVPAIWLCCLQEMTAFYEKWGFGIPDGNLMWMRRTRSDDNAD